METDHLLVEKRQAAVSTTEHDSDDEQRSRPKWVYAFPLFIVIIGLLKLFLPLCIIFFAPARHLHGSGDRYQAAPVVELRNGSYAGLYHAHYEQDVFLGVPFAQPPTGDLRFRVPRSLNSTWESRRNATVYYPHCTGVGFDQVGFEQGEDCLALNVVRPSGTDGDARLPVAVWIHGGGYIMGGTSDQRYNLSFIVRRSVEMNKPIIGVSIAYRLSGWGFLDSKELREDGSTNLGLRDQRLALEWIQENIAAFGGDPSKVTIWGESAGAGSVGMHLVAYSGRDDNLFRGAIGESGSPLLLGLPGYESASGQPQYNSIVISTGCERSEDTLQCLRITDPERLKTAIEELEWPFFWPVVDDDLLQGSQYRQLIDGKFVRVPYLLGTNTDEGSAFASLAINTDEQFEAFLNSTGIDFDTVRTLQVLYPNIPALGIPASLTGLPDRTHGMQYKRVTAFAGDWWMTVPRRLAMQQWASYGVPGYSYRFNAITNPANPYIGSTHFEEVAFVFNNIEGTGYAENPFRDKPLSYSALSDLMSSMWISFIADGDPNSHRIANMPLWPKYDNGPGGYGRNYVFEAKEPSHTETDTYRGEAIAYVNSLWKSQFGR